MKLFLNLQQYQRTKLFSCVTNTREMISVSLTALEYLQYWHGNAGTPKRPYMVVDLDDTHRIYLVDRDKIVTFLFALNVKLNSFDLCDAKNYVTGIYLRSHKISAREVSEAKQILTNCTDMESLYCYNVLEEDSNLSLETLFLFEHLLFLEWGYLRFDHDPSHAVVSIHPTDHFDVNFNPMGTYKLWLKKQIELNDIINMINKKTACAELRI